MRVARDFKPADRYVYDFGLCSTKNGFAQVDTSQDAWYFGTWANPIKRAILTYCEGDVTLEQADNDTEFAQAIRDIKRWNDENGHRFKGIDPGLDESLRAAFVTVGLGDLLY